MRAGADQPGEIALDQIEDALVGSLRLCGVRWASIDGLVGRAYTCYATLLGRADGVAFAYLPLSLVVDIYGLCVLGDRTPFSSDASGEADIDAQAAELRRRYENRVLSRLLAEPSFREAREHMQLRAGDDHRGVIRLVELVLERFAPLFPDGPRVQPARLRGLDVRGVERADVLAAGERLDDHGARLASRLEEFVERVVERVAWAGLLDATDIFELEHWRQLSQASLRTGCRELVDLSASLDDPTMPHVRPVDVFADAKTQLEDESVYPKGGFSGLCNRGSFENLVRSELVYMEPGSEVSVFDLRFVQNELLYYLRNDGSLRRRRRDVRIVLEVGDTFPVRLSGWPARWATVMQAVAITLVRRLLDVYEEDAVSASMTYALEQDSAPLSRSAAEERALIEVVLREEIAKEWVEIVGPSAEEAIEMPAGLTHLVVFTSGPEATRAWRQRLADWREAGAPVLGALVAFGEPSALETGEPPVYGLPSTALSTDTLARLTHALYATLLGAQPQHMPLLV
jgi:hypothetical protein